MKADLHIHSCLSPCGSLEMSPTRIVKEALQLKLGLIAVCDHNSAKNLPTLYEICHSVQHLNMIPGLEVCSKEEIHLLCYFENTDNALDFGNLIEKHLPPVKNRPEITGDQVYVDSNENILGTVDKYLANATDLTLEEIYKIVKKRGGLVIPAHADRPSFSLLSQLGVIPSTPNFIAVEYQGNSPLTKILMESSYKNKLIQNSDAHYPEEMAQRYQDIPNDIRDFKDYRLFLEQL